MSYEKVRDWMKTNPAVPPQMRKWAEAVDASITWATTTTTTSTSTTTTTT
jgi:hypothetical protein